VSTIDEPDDAAGATVPSTPLEESISHGRRHRSEEHVEHFRHTRISAAWVAVTVAVLFGIALIVFIAQNTKDVRLKFFAASGSIPVSVALLAAALSGAIVVLAIGVGRVAQLRFSMRRQRHLRETAGGNRDDETHPDERSSGHSH
jgi:uncharacterized integral membrane protein